MTTYNNFRNITQVINFLRSLAFDWDMKYNTHLHRNDVEIDAECIRKANKIERAQGLTIYYRNFGTQFAFNLGEDLEIRHNWGKSLLLRVTITQTKGKGWEVITKPCKFNNDGTEIEPTAEEAGKVAEEAAENARFAVAEAVMSPTPEHVAAADFWTAEAKQTRGAYLYSEWTERVKANEEAQKATEAPQAEEIATDEPTNDTPSESATESEPEAPQTDNEEDGEDLAEVVAITDAEYRAEMTTAGKVQKWAKNAANKVAQKVASIDEDTVIFGTVGALGFSVIFGGWGALALRAFGLI